MIGPLPDSAFSLKSEAPRALTLEHSAVGAPTYWDHVTRGLLRGLGLALLEGGSIGLFFAGLLVSPSLPAAGTERSLETLSPFVAAGALGLPMAALLWLAFARQASITRLLHATRRASPLTIIGPLPFFFHWQNWAGRELPFAVLVSTYAFIVHAAFSAAVRVGPLFPEAPAMRAVRAGVDRVLRRTRGFTPLLIVLLGVAGYAAFFGYHTLANHRNLLTASLDLGLENNLMWNLVHGGPFMKTSPLGAESHFGYHATLFAYVMASFYYFFPGPESLLVFQAIMIGAAALPLYLYAQRHVGRWSACVVALCYLLYAPVHGSNLYDFHYLPLGVFFLWLTLYAVDAGHNKLTVLAVLLTLSVREDVAACLIIIGAYLVMRSRNRRAAIAVTAVAAVYFFLMKMVIMPSVLKADSFIHQWAGLVPSGAKGYGGVLMTVMGNPVFTLTSLLETDKLLYTLQIGAPLAFFAWRRPIGFFLSLPGFFFTLLGTGYPPLVQISFQYTAHWSAFLFIAVVANLEWLRQPQFPGDAAGRKRTHAWLATIVLLTLITSYQFGAIFQQNTVRGGFGPYKFGTTQEDRTRHAKLYKLINRVPPMAKIVSSENIVPHVCNRPDSYTLRMGLFDAEYLLFSVPNGGEELTFIRQALAGEFGVVRVELPFVLAKRGYSKDENSRVEKLLH